MRTRLVFLAALAAVALCALPSFGVGNLDMKVAVVTYNPWMTNVAELSRSRRLNATFGWPIGYNMAKDHVSWWNEASHGMVKCTLVTNVVLSVWPHYLGGNTLTPQMYYDYRAKGVKIPFNTSFTFDYDYFLTNQCPWIVEYVNKGVIDQVWLFSFPEGGCYETRLFGWGAGYCNSPGMGTIDSERVFMMNMPSVERADTPMENFGHGAESMLATRFYDGNVPYHPSRDYSKKNDFFLFTQNYATDTNNIQVGNVHYAPNSTDDYLWGLKNYVYSQADNWYSYPDLSGEARLMNCSEWGDGVNHKHKIWWFKHFPQKVGLHRGQMMNWISVYLNPNKAAHPLGLNQEISQEDVDLAGFFPFSFTLPQGVTQAVITVKAGLPVEHGIRKNFVPMFHSSWEIPGDKPGYDQWLNERKSEQVWTLTEDSCYEKGLAGQWYITFGRAYKSPSLRPFDDSTNYSVRLDVYPKPKAQPAPIISLTQPAEGDTYKNSLGKIAWEIKNPPCDGFLSLNLAYSVNDLDGPWTEICEEYAYEMESPYSWKSFPSGVKSPTARIRLIAKDLHGLAYTNCSGVFGMRVDPVPEPAALGLLLLLSLCCLRNK